MAAIKGHVVDLEVTPGITWSGPGDRKQPLQSWRCLQEICWHRDLSTLLSLYHTHRRARAHMFRNRVHKYAQCTHSHTNGQGKKKQKKNTCACMIPTHRRTLRRQQSGVSWRDRDTLAFQQPGSLDRSGPHTLMDTKPHTHTCPCGGWHQPETTAYTILTHFDKIFVYMVIVPFFVYRLPDGWDCIIVV